MKQLFIVFLMAVAFATPALAFTQDILDIIFRPQLAKNVGGGTNGGSSCAACTLVMAVVQQTMQAKNLEPAAAFSTICGYLPKGLSDVCTIAADLVGPTTYSLLKTHSPDEICNILDVCKEETAVCRLFPAKAPKAHVMQAQAAIRVQHPIDKIRAFNICTVVPGVCNVEKHLPFSDTDGDRFSAEPTLRGSDWRGKDCNDLDVTVYPGRVSNDATADGNCNGVFGINPDTGRSYEDELCGGTNAIGVATLGDSASAHFRIPEEILMAGVMNKDTFAGLINFVTDEMDWPMLSWSTGHQPTTKYSPSVTGPMTSVYSRLKDLNKCNHRDFQNLGVNGARVARLAQWVDLLARNKASDKPILAFFAMIGNDVCNGHHDFSQMTTPADYYNAVYEAVMAADAKLPKGSQVVLVPLVDGRILYDTMHDRIHPIGALNKDVTYTDFYNYLNCLTASPCWGWMNSNATIRNTTFTIAQSLNAQLPLIASQVKDKLANIQVTYAGDVFSAALNAYPGPKSDLIEPVDGFHPSQIANSYLGNLTFNKLQELGVIPQSSNPNNAKIVQLFGDQGGY